MRPLQVFLPRLGYSIGYGCVSRDARRAFEAWEGAGQVYLLPELKNAESLGVVGREDRPGIIQAIPAEHRDDLTVFHVGSNGVIWDQVGPIGSVLPSIDGLLEAWINVDLAKGRILIAPEFTLHYPTVHEGRLVHNDAEISIEVVTERIAPGSGFPMTVDDSGPERGLGLAWPPPGTSIPSVDPDAESADTFGERVAEDRNGIAGAVDADGTWHPHLIVIWPGVFGLLIGPASGMSPFQTLTDMRAILRQAATDRPTALRRAKAKAAVLLSDGLAPLSDAVFIPTGLKAQRDGRVFAFWESYGIQAATPEEAVRSPILKELVPVTRVWGGEGLLWALLIERLEQDTPIRYCECGRMLAGRKKFCGPDDDARCFRQRRSKSQRALRRRSDGREGIAPSRSARLRTPPS